MKTLFKRSLILILGAVVLLLVIGQILNRTAESIPPLGKMFSVGDHKLHLYCTGEKSERPTVILEAGLGNAAAEFYLYQKELEKTEHVCSYDRAGAGWSELSDVAAEPENISEQLQTLLKNAKIAPPFVFASHSIGALHTRMYAHHYPEEVAGIVFIDGSHPEEHGQQSLTAPDMFEESNLNNQLRMFHVFEVFAQLGVFRIYNPLALPEKVFPEHIMTAINYYRLLPKNFAGFIKEAQSIEASYQQTLNRQHLGDIPLVVVTGPFVALSRIEGEPPNETDEKMMEIHKSLQLKTLDSSTESKMEIIEGASHMSLIFDKNHASQVVKHILDLLKYIHLKAS
ncbi:alpha/beta fold hydrolase [Thalassotalea ganghwensis]